MSARRPVQHIHPSHRERGALRPLPAHEQMRGRDRRNEAASMEQALTRLLDERNQLLQQLETLRDFADRVMTIAEEKDLRILELESALAEKQALIDALELENHALLEQGCAQSERVGQLEASLLMFAEADERLDEIAAAAAAKK